MRLNNLISLRKETVAFFHFDNEPTALLVVVSRLDDDWFLDCIIHYDVELLSLFSFSLKVPSFDDYITITVKLTNQKFLWNVNVLREISNKARAKISRYSPFSEFDSKGLFTWRWGTPGRWGNPLRWS